MAIIDLYKNYKRYYSLDLHPDCVSMEHASFLTISGKGDPAGLIFAENVSALYAVADGIKYLSKLRGKDFIVPKLESSWSYDEKQYSGIRREEAPLKIPRSAWHYTLRIRMPDFVFKKEVLQALDVARLKKKVRPEQEILFEEIPSHQVVDFLRPGLFEKEMQSLPMERGVRKNNRHQIHLSNFRKTVPEKFRAI